MRTRVGLVWAVLLGGAAAGGAQTPASAAGMGTVTGHVMCGDSQKPARFATVTLLAVPTSITPAFDPTAKLDSAGLAAATKASESWMSLVQTQTGMDGSFAAANVAPGDYYVVASVPGYVQPMSQVQAALDAGVDLSKPIAGLTIVHVTAERAVTGDVTVERGAAISGKVLWDDGSPVTRAMVTVEAMGSGGASDGAAAVPATKPKRLPPEFMMLSMAGGVMGGGSSGSESTSDDLGQYRIAGLAPGAYLVKVTLRLHTSFSMQAATMNLKATMADKPLVLFAPSTLHRAEGKPVVVKGGDEATDEDVTVNLAGMHMVSGRVDSAEDHHGINTGTVVLTDTTDKDVVRGASVDASGNFAVTFVPPGTYSLTVTDAADTQPSKKQATGMIKFATEDTVRSYEDGKQSVIVTDSDVVGLMLDLTPSKTTKKGVDLNDVLKP